MKDMVMTLEVLNVSGWLSADAFCRVARGVYDVAGGEVRAGRREVLRQRRRAAGAAQTEGLGGEVCGPAGGRAWGWGGGRGMHGE